MTRHTAAPSQTSPQPDPATFRPGFAHLLADETGQDLVEYALLAALLGLAATTAIKGLGTKIASAFTSVSSSLTSNT